jgi:hypothetical protein
MRFFLMAIGSTSCVILPFLSSLQEERKGQDEVSIGKQPPNDKVGWHVYALVLA